jgi:NADH:ubiquinone oxidoreductase subunit D
MAGNEISASISPVVLLYAQRSGEIPATRISHREMTHLQHQQVFVASQSCVPAAKALADIEVPIGRMVHWCTSNGKAPAMFPGG